MITQELLSVLNSDEAIEAKEWEDLFAQPAWKRLMKLLESDIERFKESAIVATSFDDVCRQQGGRNVLLGILAFQARTEAFYAEVQEQRTKQSESDLLDTPDDSNV